MYLETGLENNPQASGFGKLYHSRRKKEQERRAPRCATPYVPEQEVQGQPADCFSGKQQEVQGHPADWFSGKQ
jgi:hypothetical protein